MFAFQDGPSLAGQPATQQAPAAGTAGSQVPGTPTSAPAAPPGADFMWMLLPVLFGAMLLSMFSGRKQKKKKDQMLSALKKHDRVVTTGGLIGFVAEVKPDVVVLKVEEGRDVRVTFTRDAIAAILTIAPETAATTTQDN